MAKVVVLIAVAQVVAGVLVYRIRVVDHWTAGDLLVFGGPVVAALVAQLIVASCAVPAGARIWLSGRAAGVAIAVTAVAFFATMLVNLNVYGS